MISKYLDKLSRYIDRASQWLHNQAFLMGKHEMRDWLKGFKPAKHIFITAPQFEGSVAIRDIDIVWQGNRGFVESFDVWSGDSKISHHNHFIDDVNKFKPVNG